MAIESFWKKNCIILDKISERQKQRGSFRRAGEKKSEKRSKKDERKKKAKNGQKNLGTAKTKGLISQNGWKKQWLHGIKKFPTEN